MDFDLEREYPVKSVKQLLRAFYKHNGEVVRRKRRGLEPITLILNPPQITDETDPSAVDTYYAIYTKKYYVVVTQSSTSQFSGPHAAKLWFEVHGPLPAIHKKGIPSREAYRIHLGTIQICANFYDEKKIRVALRRAIRRREYFTPEEKLEELIEFVDQYDETISL